MILVIGESCLDIFHYGESKRLCPEAPVPVFKSLRTVESGGMAMNVYNNLKKMNLKANVLTNLNWKNIKKTRFVDENSNHMFIRLDENDDIYYEMDFSSIEKINFDDYQAIVVSDYNKGFLTEKHLKFISDNHPLTFLDTKKILGTWSHNFSFIKINSKEFDNTKHTIDEKILSKLIVTRGPHGCEYGQKIYKVSAVEVKDTSGAGDTFIAGLCGKFCQTKNIDLSIDFANECATTVVQKRGVSTI